MSSEPISVAILTRNELPQAPDTLWRAVGLNPSGGRGLQIITPDYSPVDDAGLLWSWGACSNIPMSAEELDFHHDNEGVPDTSFLTNFLGLDSAGWNQLMLEEESERGSLHMEQVIYTLTQKLEGIAFRLASEDLEQGINTQLLAHYHHAPTYQHVFLELGNQLVGGWKGELASDSEWSRLHDTLYPWLETNMNGGELPEDITSWLARAQEHAAAHGFHTPYDDPFNQDYFLNT